MGIDCGGYAVPRNLGISVMFTITSVRSCSGSCCCVGDRTETVQPNQQTKPTNQLAIDEDVFVG